MNINLTSLTAPHFYKLINPSLDRKINELVLSGGRGSIKSSFASLLIVYGMMEDYYRRGEITHCVVLRKVANTLKQSVFSQIKWAINMLGVSHLWKCTSNPMQCTFKPSGQSIIFTGCDDPMKVKSIKFEKGYPRYRWYEEYNQFDGLEEIRNLNFSLARGGDCLGIYTYNPDPDSEDWANLEAQAEEAQKVEGRLRHHSTFEDLPEHLKIKFLGKDFIRQVEDLKKRDLSAYKNEILGLVTGLGGNIFKNIKYRSFTDDIIYQFDKIRQGLDFGFTIDPCAFVMNMYQRDKRSLSIFDEIFGYELSTRQLSQLINKKYRKEEVIKADSAEQRTIDTMIFEHYINVRPCEKGPDSVRHGIEWLRGLDTIYIDKKRCPNTWREFKNYQFEKDKKTGKFKNKYPDENNHCMSKDTKVIIKNKIDVISNLRSGQILSYNIKNNKLEYKNFYDCRKTGTEKIYKIKLSNGKIIKCTDYHPILTINGYKTIKTLKKGDKIIDVSNSIKNSQSINIVNQCAVLEVVAIQECGEQDVWNMEVEDNHNFVLENGVIVHNCIDATRYSLDDIILNDQWRLRNK